MGEDILELSKLLNKYKDRLCVVTKDGTKVYEIDTAIYCIPNKSQEDGIIIRVNPIELKGNT